MSIFENMSGDDIVLALFIFFLMCCCLGFALYYLFASLRD